MVNWRNIKKTAKRAGLSILGGLLLYAGADSMQEYGRKLNATPPANALNFKKLGKDYGLTEWVGYNLAHYTGNQLPTYLGFGGAILIYGSYRKRVDKGRY